MRANINLSYVLNSDSEVFFFFAAGGSLFEQAQKFRSFFVRPGKEPPRMRWRFGAFGTPVDSVRGIGTDIWRFRGSEGQP